MARLTKIPDGLDRVGVARLDEEPPGVHPSFMGLPKLEMKTTAPLPQVPTAGPSLLAPGTDGQGTSYYVFCAGVLIEIDLQTNVIRRHEVPFDSGSNVIYSSGATSAYLAENGRIYFAPAGKPARVAVFNPGTCGMKLLGSGLDGWSYSSWCEDRQGRLYVMGYPGLLARIDMENETVEGLGRLTTRALYCWRSPLAADEDGRIYAVPGPRGFALVVYDPVTNTVEILHEGQARIIPNNGRPYVRIGPKANESKNYDRLAVLQDGKAVPIDEAPEVGPWTYLSTSLDKQFEIEWIERAPICRLRHRLREAETWQEIEFEVPTSERILDNLSTGPDGRIYMWGSYCMSIHDPVDGQSTYCPDLFGFSMYDATNHGEDMYWGGYPSGRLSVLDTSQPVKMSKDKKSPESNPRDLQTYHEFEADGEMLGVHRLWSLCNGADDRIYMAASASRWYRGGALIWFDPRTGESGALRSPFRFLGVTALTAIQGGQVIAGVTWTSPDPLFSGDEPDEAILFLFDVATQTITKQCVPLPGCKVLTSIHEATPGKLVGLGMPAVPTLHEADDSYYGDTTLFFLELETMKVTTRIDTPYSLCRRAGRAFCDAPDGSIWVSGGGALLRVDPHAETIKPLAVIEEDGNFLIQNEKLYLAGQASLRIAEIGPLLRTNKERRKGFQ
ncbi:MAG: hypothetical protein O3B01_24770 [Planctomycetota bacterium]|nr:hypothetical protein [Planctomycetota bacterium]